METRKKITDIAGAHFRFGLIAPLIQGTYPDESQAAYCRRVTEKPVRKPDGSEFVYSPKTLAKWAELYRKGGMDALMQKERKDCGSTRVLQEKAIEEIHRLKEKYPRLNAVQIHLRLIEMALLPATVSAATVQRYIKRNGLKGSAVSVQKDRKAFEEAHFGGMWQADTCYLPYLKEGGKSRRTYLIMTVDDCSRMIVGGRIFYLENGYSFQKVLKEAVAAYGIPQKLYVDNGSPYSNEQLELICGSIGTVLLHAPVRDGASKGKVERNFRTLKERWLYGLDMGQIQSLDEFNRLLFAYIRVHNTTKHGGTGKTPLERFVESRDQIRCPKSREWLDECFHNRAMRCVNRDATLSLDGVSYDAPMEFIGTKVEIRYLPDEMEKAYILSKGKRYPIRRTNRVENGKTKREKLPAIDYALRGGSDSV